MKKILLTGADGFVGSYVRRAFVQDGESILSPSRQEFNLFQLQQVTNYFERNRPTELVHLAWYTEHGTFWESYENLKWRDATIHMAREFIRCGGSRIVAAGTCAEYAWGGDQQLGEADLAQPSSLYGKMKLETFNELEKICRTAKVSMAWGRIFLLYGPGESRSRIIPKVILSLLRNEKISLSSGKQIRDYLHVSDVAKAFVCLLKSQSQGVVNISSGQPKALKEVFDWIGDHLACSHLLNYGEEKLMATDPPVLVGKNQRLKDLGWTPSVFLEDGLLESIHWWKEQLEKGATQ